MTVARRGGPGAVLLLGLVLCLAGRLEAQEPDTAGTPVDSVVVTPEADPTLVPAAPDTTPLPVSPRGAFLRSMVLPGWGQAAFGATVRGGVYFAGWAANGFMNFRNFKRLDAARERQARREDQILEALLAGSGNPDSLRAVIDSVPSILEDAVAGDETADDLRKLVRAREQQREDWIAWSIFWMLASGVDGYVTAQLSDFPVSIDVEGNRDRSVSVRLEVPLPGRRP